MRISSNPGIPANSSMPPASAGTPIRRARARPSDSGSIPTSAPISRTVEVRSTLIIRSVPMFPEPRIATLVFISFQCTAPPAPRVLMQSGRNDLLQAGNACSNRLMLADAVVQHDAARPATAAIQDNALEAEFL